MDVRKVVYLNSSGSLKRTRDDRVGWMFPFASIANSLQNMCCSPVRSAGKADSTVNTAAGDLLHERRLFLGQELNSFLLHVVGVQVIRVEICEMEGNTIRKRRFVKLL